MTTRSRLQRLSLRVRTFARVAATSLRATWSSPPACGSAPAQLGALAAAGVAAVVVRAPSARRDARDRQRARRARRARSGPVRSTSRTALMLAAALAAAGADIELLPAVADDESAHREALERGLAADVLVTSGGVSVGPHDLVRQIEAELGVEEVFWRVAIKPGKPVVVRRARRDARLRAAGEPGVVARRLRALREAGAARAAGTATIRCRASSRGGSRARSAPERRPRRVRAGAVARWTATARRARAAHAARSRT